MSDTPAWVRRNRRVAWTSYFCVLTGFATLAMGLTAAGTGHTGWALTAGIICAVALIGGITLFGTTAHHDHVTHHAIPNLLSDSWPGPALSPPDPPRDPRPRLRRGH
ncbi:hypothetical protein [Nocardia spumae]|uniref:hypothetical protein n=1 Tax=Nocardia spumae TaxID=2887190 RepID=UPI001D13AA15|nr:hypothetical protein [Nocardia spumae]